VTRPWLSALDIRIGLRMLARYPILTAVSTAAMAVAIALGVLYCEATDKFKHPRVPLPDGRQLVSVHQWDVAALTGETRLLHEFTQWRDATRSIEHLGAAVTFQRNLATDDKQVEPVLGAELTASAFVITGTPALHGRTLLPRDEEPGEPPVVLLGHRIFTSRFNSDPSVVGRSVQIGSVHATVIGVMPEGFAFPVNHQLWMPLKRDALNVGPRSGPSTSLFGRLAPGVSLSQADAELAVFGQRLAAESPSTHATLQPRVRPYAEPLAEGGERKVISAVLVAVNGVFFMLLAVMSANVATLVSARTATRQWEFTVRSALGADRARIIKQLFSEALVLTALATLTGLVIARIALEVGVAQFAASGALPFWITPSLSWRTVLYSAVLAVFAAAIVGIIPAWRVSRVDVQQALRSASQLGAARFGAVWTVLIVLQVAITVLFLPLVGGGVIESNRFNQRAEGIGAERFVAANLSMDHEEFGLDSAQQVARTRGPVAALSERLTREPGVAAVAFADRLPVEDQFKYRFAVDTTIGRPITDDLRSTLVHVSGQFFESFGSAVVTGRGFEPLDETTGRVMLVNQSFVQHILGGANPVGWRVRLLTGEVESFITDDYYEIVGVVRDFGWQLPRPEEQSAMYLPSAPVTGRASQIVVRLTDVTAMESVAQRLRSIAAEVDPSLRLTDLKPLADAGGGEAASNWTLTIVAGLIAGFVMLLSAMGIYALMSFTVARRTREIGIRIALGAGPRSIVWGMFRRAFLQLGAGLVVGTAVAALAGLESPTQRWMLLGADVLMLCVGLAACALPVRRALRVDPVVALRME
jgi:predicted permease